MKLSERKGMEYFCFRVFHSPKQMILWRVKGVVIHPYSFNILYPVQSKFK